MSSVKKIRIERSEEMNLSKQPTKSRFKNWKKKLLDLTLRNRFLNFKKSSAIKIISKDLYTFEDKLEEGNQFKFISKEKSLDKDGNIISLKEDTLVLDLKKEEITPELYKLHKKNKSFISETGDNRLFLSIGFLHYFDEKRDKQLTAPLVLIPISLDRKNIKSDFKLSKYDSNSKFNITLLEFLKENYNITIEKLENDLPKDASGLDIKKIFDIIDIKIKNLNDDRWFINREECFLSLFSFKKILMYKDIENLDSLEDQPILKLLDNPADTNIQKDLKDNFTTSSLPDKKLDEIHPRELYLPVSYDSSQLQAILHASKGNSFVLQGPPGTGKSQTITNIISQLLAEGKKVLFVAEKLVALNVVKKRLEESGLGQFFLELHSDKSKKGEIAKKLMRNYELSQERKENTSSNWEIRCEKLKKARDEINEYIQLLHKKQKCGLTAFEALSIINGWHEQPKLMDFNLESSEQLNEDELKEIEETIDKTQESIRDLNYKVSNHSLDGVKITWSTSAKDDLNNKIDTLLMILDSLIPQFDSFLKRFSHLPKEFIHHSDLSHFIKILSHIPKDKYKHISYRLFFHENFKEIKKFFNLGLAYKKDIDLSYKRLSTKYKENLNINQILVLKNKFDTASEKNFLVRIILQNKILKEFQKFTTLNKKVKKDNFIKDVRLLKFISSRKTSLDNLFPRETKHLLWKGKNTNWKELDNFLNWSNDLQKILNGFSNLYFWGCTKELMGDMDDIEILNKEVKEMVDNFSKLTNLLKEYKNQGINFLELNQFINNKDWALHLRDLCKRRKRDLSTLRQWLEYDMLRDKLLEYKTFNSFIDFLKEDGSDLKDIKKVFRFNFSRIWFDLLYKENEILGKYYSSKLDNLVKKFKILDQEIIDLSKDKIQNQIFAFMYQEDNQINILNRESQKKKRHKPVRTLYSDMPNVMQSLSPCLLMSPLSVAQYLPIEKIKFDVVIFDEASQIPPWDAIGVMARANQVIVVGDSKQLPPTSFFQSGESEDYDENEDYETLESILEECEASGFSRLRLKGHYRSEHESLIAFSNKTYYNGDLITFPSNKIETNNMAISIEEVKKGVFETETNQSQAEARAIADKITEWLLDDNFNSSIGVVTFNSDQQKLVEEFLDKKKIENPQIEKYFNSETNEPVIVKNLENIQGDERDIIIFSIGFGSIGNQKLNMNFGALNKEGGEKRLNVAITRARKKMYIYTGIRYKDIDLDRTSAIGMKDLKHFLEYAEKGYEFLFNYTQGSVGGYESPFEKEVANQLNNLGWRTKPQIGVGKFRIDLGVLHPEKEGEFLAGIETDGATYHSSATARDRDRIKEDMLVKLGWNIFRIWSTNWWEDKEKEISKLDEKLRKLLSSSKQTN